MPARFSPRSGRSPDLGLASDSKPRGCSVTAVLATLLSHWPLCWWLAGGQLSKAGGRGACFVLAPLLVKIEFSVLNDYNLVIDCFAGYFTQLLNPVEGFCVELAPCWCLGCHVHAWLANLLARGVARALWLPGLSLSPLRIPFGEFSQIY